jgi:hypothetical protein
VTPRRTRERSGRGKRSRSLGEILARQRALIERSAEQRWELADHLDGLAPAFAPADRAVEAARSVLSHRFLLAAAGLLLLAVRPRATLALAARVVAFWNGARAARRLLTAVR